MKPKATKKNVIILSMTLTVFVVATAVVLILKMVNGKSGENVESAKDTSAEQVDENDNETEEANSEAEKHNEEVSEEVKQDAKETVVPTAAVPTGGNCSTALGKLMLINANFTVDNTFIANRRNQLVDLATTYGVREANSWNGTPLLDSEAAAQLYEMMRAYSAENQGHSLSTMSCFRSYGTSCGRLCAATGTSDHHTGYTCDLIDTDYGSTLDTDYYNSHPDWQWLKANSYKYGFIDRYPIEWAGSSMSEPLNVDANGTTGYYETWHYRYVGNPAATEIAQGKYNGGRYDSLEHYLKMIGMVKSLNPAGC